MSQDEANANILDIRMLQKPIYRETGEIALKEKLLNKTEAEPRISVRR